MQITGITFIRNALRYDYPIVESIRSVLPLVDTMIVAVGRSEDATRELIAGLNSAKIEILDTVWDDSLRTGGRVLAEETDKALRAVPTATDWVLYIQGDEVLHEQYHEPLRASMTRWKDDAATDGLLFDYLHFYGSYDYVGDSLRWYRREVRVVRPNRGIYSYRDAQGFRMGADQKLRVRHSGATMYHYGWVKDPRAMQRKAEDFNRYWHDDAWLEENIARREAFDYGEVDALRRFEGSHPEVMNKRIDRLNWEFDHDPSMNRYGFKERCKRWIEGLTGFRPGEYRNYRLLK